MTQHTLASELRHVAEQLARAAGDMALKGRKSGDVTAITKSSPTDMVTQYDKASEEMVTTGLRTLRPDDAIVGEEGANYDGTSGITWHIDPIDGTSNFYFDIPMWAVSIGAVDTQGPIAGAASRTEPPVITSTRFSFVRPLISSLRRHYPDQVLGSVAAATLSARRSDELPVVLFRQAIAVCRREPCRAR